MIWADPDPIIDAIEEFVTGTAPGMAADRVLTTIMFTDIVASTREAARVGDHAWRMALDRHDAVVQRHLERHRGRRINTTGDAIVATFDGPARAVRCALAISESVADLSLQVRCGVHTGEVTLRGTDIGRLAVHIAARVMGCAGPGEVVATRTVTDLVAGSGLAFADLGARELRGVPGALGSSRSRSVPADDNWPVPRLVHLMGGPATGRSWTQRCGPLQAAREVADHAGQAAGAVRPIRLRARRCARAARA